MTVRADGVFIWWGTNTDGFAFKSPLRVFVFHLLISFLDLHSVAFEATLLILSIALDASSIYPAGYSRTNTLTHVRPLSHYLRYCLRRLCRIDSVSPCPAVTSSGEAHGAPFVVSDCGRAPCQRTFGPRAQV